MTNKSLGSDIYSGLASFGEIKALIILIIGGLLALGLLGGGIYFISTAKKSEKITATITDAVCGYPIRGKYKCNINYKYTVNGVTYDGKLPTYSTSYPLKNGDSIDIYYEKDNPSVSDNQDKKQTGIAMIVVGIIIVLFLGANYYFTRKSKGYAAFTGVGSLFSGFGGSRSYYGDSYYGSW